MLKKKVLLVDDVEPFLDLERRFFNEDEFSVDLACDGCDALTKAAEDAPDLIFMDLFMPKMGGLECCRSLKGDPRLKNIPVVIVTASGYESDYESCREAGCAQVLPKPVNRRQVQGTARKLLGLKERYQDRIKARLLVRYGKGDAHMSDYSVNLSTGGLFLETDTLLSIGTRITAEFLLPDGPSSIRCSARIAWLNSPHYKTNPSLSVGMGVQFLDMGLKEMDAIRGFVRNQEIVPLW